MTLPVLKYNYKEITLPISKKKIMVRPFVVKEQKNMLMIKEGEENPQAVFEGICQLIEACSKGDFDPRQIPTADVEYIFLQIRSLSIGETVNLAYICKAKVEKEGKEEECGGKIQAKINLKEVGVEEDPLFQDLFEIPGTEIKIKFRIPTGAEAFNLMDRFQGKSENDLNPDEISQVFFSMTEMIIEGTKTHTEFTQEEYYDFIDSVPTTVVEDILFRFFQRLPTLSKTIEMKCPDCGTEHKVLIKGVNNFFPSASAMKI